MRCRIVDFFLSMATLPYNEDRGKPSINMLTHSKLTENRHSSLSLYLSFSLCVVRPFNEKGRGYLSVGQSCHVSGHLGRRFHITGDNRRHRRLAHTSVRIVVEALQREPVRLDRLSSDPKIFSSPSKSDLRRTQPYKTRTSCNGMPYSRQHPQ